MGTQENGLTVEQLALRFEGLQRENAQRLEALERENAELRQEVSALRGSGTRRDELPALRRLDTHRTGKPVAESDGRVSRRSLLSKAGAAAVAAVAAGTLLSPREANAHHWSPGISVNFLDTHEVTIVPLGDNHALTAHSNSGIVPTLYAFNANARGTGVQGKAWTGVLGSSEQSGGTGHPEGVGVRGIAKDGTGVWGSSSKTGYSGVYGQHTGTAGYGVAGDGTGSGAGVLGRNTNGNGIEGRDSRYGGKFAGSRAQLMLEPKSNTGRPTSGAHSKGEIYMDSAGALFVCVRGGTPGRWRKVSTTAV